MTKRKLFKIQNITSIPKIPKLPRITNNHSNNSYKKEQIPKRIRELVWNTYNGEKYNSKCYVNWCNNNINVFNYQVGHDIPQSKGGPLHIDNLRPICGNCNLSMSNKYSITEWSNLIKPFPETVLNIPPTLNTILMTTNNNIDLELSESLHKSIKKTLKRTYKEINTILENDINTIPVIKPDTPDTANTPTTPDIPDTPDTANTLNTPTTQDNIIEIEQDKITKKYKKIIALGSIIIVLSNVL
jgi:hypothetical protein